MPTPNSEDLAAGRPGARTALGDWLAILGFALLLLAPLCDQLVRPAEERSTLTEMRGPAPFPPLDGQLRSLRAFPRGFEAWYDDCFGLRDRFIRAHNALAIWVLHDAPAPNVVLGADDWIFYRGHLSMETHRGTAPLSEAELEDWRAALEARRDLLAGRGIAFLYALVPNKTEVYPERLPAAYDVVGPSRRAQLVEHMAARSDVAFVDLLPALLAEKAHDSAGDHVYFPLGTHWGSRGAWAGYFALVVRLRERFPDMRPWPRRAFLALPGRTSGDSWAERFYLPDLLTQDFEVLIPIDKFPAEDLVLADSRSGQRYSLFEHEDASLPTALVFHDSYGPMILPYLAQHFSRLDAYWRRGFSEELVDRHRPDVVIQIYSERTLVTVRPGEEDGEAGAALRERFDASTDVRLLLDARTDPGELELVGAPVLRRAGDARGGIAVTIATPRDLIRLQDFAPARAGELCVLALEVETARPLRTHVYYQTAAQPEFTRERCLVARFEPGRSTALVPLAVDGFNGALLVRLDAEPGELVLHRAEVRAVPSGGAR